MHVLFIHPAFPAQFGHLASQLATHYGWKCTFLTSVDTSNLQLPFDHWSYHVKPGPLPKIYRSDRTAGEPNEHMLAIYKGLRATPQIQPDLVVGHTYFGSLLFLKNLYHCPLVGYFEWLPPPFWTDAFALRPDYPPNEIERLAAGAGHVLNDRLIHLVDAAYSPTRFQASTAPPECQHKIKVCHDGIDSVAFSRRPEVRGRSFRGLTISPQTKVVTYVSPGLESWRGFDIFMQTAKRLAQQYPDIVFLIAGEELTQYGHEGRLIEPLSFKQHVLNQDQYDLERFHFLGRVSTDELITLFSLSDLHVYLTVPFVVSWSLLQAMSTGCTILGSATPPVLEICQHGVNALLADFYDVDALTAQAITALDNPDLSRRLGTAARQHICERYEQNSCVQQLAEFFESVVQRSRTEGTSSAAGPAAALEPPLPAERSTFNKLHFEMLRTPV